MASSRLTREDWIAVARKAFVASGVDDVKIDVLARRMKVTRGSFYWHFKHRQDLLDALLQDWEANNRREIEEIGARAVGNGDELIELFKIWLDEDPLFPAFDIAIRGWARKSKNVAKTVRTIDDAWIAMLQATLEKGGIPHPLSFVRARVMYFHQVGYLALSIKESMSERIKLAPYYYEALTGKPPPEDLLSRLRILERPMTRSRNSKKVDSEA